MSDDIVTRLREYEAITDNAYVINALVAAADEIERWRDVALCYACRPTQGNYCLDHYQVMNAPAPWVSTIEDIETIRKQRDELAWAIAWFLNGGSRDKLEARFKAYEEQL